MYKSQNKNENKKHLKLLLILAGLVAVFFFGYIEGKKATAWELARAECLEQAAKIEKAWCTDNNKLVK